MTGPLYGNPIILSTQIKMYCVYDMGMAHYLGWSRLLACPQYEKQIPLRSASLLGSRTLSWLNSE